MSDSQLSVPSTIKRFRSAMIEAENRAEAVTILMRNNYRVYRPEVDCEGEDLLVKAPGGEYLSVQLKSRLRVDLRRYGEGNIWMLFPSQPFLPNQKREWFFIPHAKLFEEMGRLHGSAPGWQKHQNWGVRNVPKKMMIFLEPYKIGSAIFEC